MIRLENVSRVYGKRSGKPLGALKNVSLELPDTGMVFIIGKSGCGKTTLMNLLSKLDFPDEGKISIDGKSEFSASEADAFRNAHISIIFQDLNLLDDLSVGENLKLAREINGEKLSDLEADEYLAAVSLQGLADRSVNHLSGGQKQRVAIARALVENPKIVFADEPTGSLDQKNGDAVLQILKDLSPDRLVVVVTHDTDAAYKYADRIVRLVDGKIAEDVILNPEYNGEVVVTDRAVILPSDMETDAAAEIIARRGKRKVLRSAEPRFIPFSGVCEGNEVYADDPATKMPRKIARRLAVSKIKRHRMRFILSVSMIAVSLAVFGLSCVFSSYDVGDVFARNLEEFPETGINVRKGRRYPPLGYVSRTWGEPLYDDDRKFVEDSGVTGVLDPYYWLRSEDYFFGNMDVDSVFLRSNFNGYAEIAGSLSDYGFTVLEGKFPESGARDENGLLHVAVTDYALYMIYEYGALTADGESLLGISAKDIIGKVLRTKADNFYISAVLKTDFEQFKPLLFKNPEDISDMEHQRFVFRIDKYYRQLFVAEDAHLNLFGQSVSFNDRQLLTWSLFDKVLSAPENIQSQIVWKEGREDFFLKPGEVLLSMTMFRQFYWCDYDPTQDFQFKDPRWYQGDYLEYAVEEPYTVVGVFTGGLHGYEIRQDTSLQVVYEDGDFAVAANYKIPPVGWHIATPTDKAAIAKLVNYLDEEAFYIESDLAYYVYNIYNTLTQCSVLFQYVSILFALICILFIADFMMSNIRDRQSEIGILRSMGVRGADVSRIFFLQALLIFGICVAVAVGGIIGGTFGLNSILRFYIEKDLNTSLVRYIPLYGLSFPPFLYTVLLLVGILAFATALPTLRLIRMKPIDCIKE
ncbi:MAG: ATP-binding cassette domain-containing protein [Clostridiales bacterium]|jgi:ABC-type lipoprotein export system ATPase subunit|nr:ATP-binding cassette domain-containing protein [Clostridiales bacterium]